MKRIHHLNCGTLCPFGGYLVDGVSRGAAARLVCHCLLLEGRNSLILVDTGLGTRDVQNPSRLSRFLRGVLRPQLAVEETAVDQIRRLGYSPNDVGHIVITHLDFDHAGGVEDFPRATVHVSATEREAALTRKGFIEKQRYQPSQFNDAHFRAYHPTEGENWFGFDSIRYLEGIEEDVRLIPLSGHTAGHCGVAVQDNDGRWLLHAGDAYFYREEMKVSGYECTPGLRAYQKMMEVDHQLRIGNQKRLRELVLNHSDQVDIISAHDPMEYDRYALRDAKSTYSPRMRMSTGAEIPTAPTSNETRTQA